ncbi:hypothetical protein WEB32_15710 [Streptomyces netropsis]|uniref:Uncharacterized protein n=1 Tax=Streptomyces netropsis TaxID=55404 RepID=A0A7W7LAM2_STRNE|nr:hypothetical protein [Streptomyces netropsis]MBB4886718.1 hypothetical protein [Streptomyces netropsis]GGR22640.1 hypothetical protein GCM10010219_29090 [Streptomyces netropsis]
MRNSRQRIHDLIVFVAVLATGIVLVCLGVAPESLATVAIALSGLYASWRGGRPGPRS